MSNQYLGEIRCVGFKFAPYGWALCDGQILSISANTALFSLFGTYYGGNGQSNFALPNLQGAVAIGQGNGPGLSPYNIGETGGVPAVTLTLEEMAKHTHIYSGNIDDAPANVATPNTSASFSTGVSPPTAIYTTATSPAVPFNPQALGPAGNGAPHNNMMPYLTLNFVVALTGIYPPRS